jgi:small-conductance mechanosensitive channel
LRAFRQATVLAVALTAFILLFVADGGAQPVEPEADAAEALARTPAAATEEAVGSLRATWYGFRATWPKFAIAIATLVIGWAVARLVRAVVYRVTRVWSRSQALSALSGIAVWLLAIGLAASVIVGDVRALVGSLGLIGLALSWALQTPIESFTGWLLNSFQGYYRVGDRVLVGEVFGDVVKIDFLTTTVWEIGTPQRPGFVNAEQPTGRVVTFPNSEVLTGTIVNLTRDFPYVWDELAVAVANESDLRHAMAVLERTASELLAPMMAEPAQQYRVILQRAGLAEPVPDKPQVFVASTESWTDISIRYLVPARERRKWKSELLVRTNEVLAHPENARRVLPAYPRRQVQPVSPDGRAVVWAPAGSDGNG